MIKHFGYTLILMNLFTFAQNQDSERRYYLPQFKNGDVWIARSDQTRIGERILLQGEGWRGFTSGEPIHLVISRADGKEEVSDVNEPSRAFLFPWSHLSHHYNRELRLYNPQQMNNRSVIVVGEDVYRQDRILPEEEIVIEIPQGVNLVALGAKEPLLAYVIWKHDGHIKWIDRGESATEERGIEAYEVVLEGPAVAIQCEVAGPESMQLDRSASLRPEVSLITYTEQGVTRAVWTATDLQPIGRGVIGVVLAKQPYPHPRISDVIASDAEGNPIEVGLHLVRWR